MGANLTDRPSQTNATTDQDLVQLAGDHAYQYVEKPDKITVNGKDFEILDTLYDTSSGLDALTVRNMDSKEKEISIVYVGSDPKQLKRDWIDTNLNLIGEAEPQQLADAKDYFDDMEDKHGTIAHVTGNSLGGANANRVAIENPHVRSVTLNPAMLPGEMVDASKNYSNITNYQSEYDILTHVQESIDYDHRVPGTNYDIGNGLPLFSSIASNHTGYVPADKNDEYTVEVGTEGEPGHGFIHVGADDHIVTSVWNGAPLHAGANVPIDIRVGDMQLLADRLKNDISGRIALAGTYTSNAVEIVEDEHARFHERVTTLQNELLDMLDSLVTDPLFQGASGIGNAIKTIIDGLISVFDVAEEKLLVLNIVLNSAPAELIESALSIDISVETIFDPARRLLESVKDEVDQLIAGIDKVIDEDIPASFEGGKEMYVDAVAGELHAHYQVVEESKDGLLSQVKGYEDQVSGVAEAFTDMDAELGIAIASNRLPSEGKGIVAEAPQITVPSSDYLENNLSIKEIQVEFAHNKIRKSVTMALSPILKGIEVLLYSFESVLDGSLFTIHSVANVIAYNPVGLVANIFTDYVDQVQAAADEVAKPLYNLQEKTENLKRGIQEANDNLPELLEYFEKYVDVAIFTPSKFHDLQLYNIASSTILNEMSMLFHDIVFQLSNHKAKAIEGTVATSKSVLTNIEILQANVEKGTK